MIAFSLAIPGLGELAARFAEAPDEWDRAIGETMEAAVLVSEREVVERAPVDTGRLRNAIVTSVNRQGPDVVGRVSIQNLDYAVYQEWGTGVHSEYPGSPKEPYVIVPREKKALRFTVGGSVVLRRRASHSGTRPKRYFREGGRAAEPRIIRLFGAMQTRLTRRLAGEQ